MDFQESGDSLYSKVTHHTGWIRGRGEENEEEDDGKDENKDDIRGHEGGRDCPIKIRRLQQHKPTVDGITVFSTSATTNNNVGKQIPSFLWPVIMAIYSSILGYCMVVQINQEATIQTLEARLVELEKFVNYTMVKQSESLRDELIKGTEVLVNEKIFESFKYLNGSRCLAIAQNCAVDFIKYVPTSILYSGISKCGQLVGLSS